MRIPTHNKTKPNPWPVQYTLTNLSTCPNTVKLTQPRIHPNLLNPKPKPQPRFSITVPAVKALDTLHHSSSLHYNSKFMPCSCTPTTLTLFSIVPKVSVPVRDTHACTALKKKYNTAADDLQKQVALEKKM